ncbi:surface lipoprotein assembly modifier [Glaesserella parasuis]|uniref:surface lipoprotein assembly modifier n=1 Tax=Glaesserella parasuis TaxID=738 RepID=UPI00135DABBB|nr:porin family protein [Glaesserella parasuis]MWQ15722.1 DUF560 domain-containing protein [Glaesserella parasuis]
MNHSFISATLLLVLANYSIAKLSQDSITEHLNDNRVQAEKADILIHSHQFKVHQIAKEETDKSSITMTSKELVKYPDLVIRALLPAVMQGNIDNVELLYPIYQQLPAQFHDPILTKWASAIVAKKNQQHTEAIKLYRQILAEQADIQPVRLQLAVALFENNELEASEDQFKKLRSEPLIPEITQLIDQYLNAINQRDRWTFSGGVTYLNDPNINNAPKAGTTYGNWHAPKLESAEGAGFNFVLGKKWSWGNGFFNELRLATNGKYYWDNKKYNEMSLRGSVGLGFQNAKYNLTLLPFMEQTLYAGGSNQSDTLKRFSKSGGLTLETNYWLSPKWQLNANYEYAEQRYASRLHLNGNYHFISGGLVYLANANQYWFANLNYNRTATRDKDDSFFRRGISLGWGQEWGRGFSTRLSVSVAQKRYKGAMPIFNIIQRNKEYGFNASIWHRAVHLWGITPRLTYNFTKTQSNHVLYSYDKHRVFIELSKQI